MYKLYIGFGKAYLGNGGFTLSSETPTVAVEDITDCKQVTSYTQEVTQAGDAFVLNFDERTELTQTERG